MRRLKIFASFCAAVGLAACGDDYPGDDRYGGGEVVDEVVPMWIESHAHLDGGAAREGCDLWAGLGVTCRLVADERNAAIRVYARPAGCRSDNGATTLATAYADGSIRVDTDCFVRRDLLGNESLDTDMLAEVIGHEAGHEFGIWEHVPKKCGAEAERHPSGRPVCGRALMNAVYDGAVDYVTDIDALAFDLRDADNSAIDRGLAGDPGGEDVLPPVICDFPSF